MRQRQIRHHECLAHAQGASGVALPQRQAHLSQRPSSIRGDMSNIDALYEFAPERLPRHVFSDEVATRLVKKRYGDSSDVHGAAWLWPERGE
jgi:hypothetical protein